MRSYPLLQSAPVNYDSVSLLYVNQWYVILFTFNNIIFLFIIYPNVPFGFISNWTDNTIRPEKKRLPHPIILFHISFTNKKPNHTLLWIQIDYHSEKQGLHIWFGYSHIFGMLVHEIDMVFSYIWWQKLPQVYVILLTFINIISLYI